MGITIQQVKNHLTGQLHGGTLNKVRNIEQALERASSNVLANIKPIESQRFASLSSLIYDDVYLYALPSDFGWIIDLIPQGTRESNDLAQRKFSQPFDLRKSITDKEIAIDGREGVKYLRVNWRSHAPISIDGMNATTNWSVVGTASGLKAQTLYKINGNASLEADLAVSGDGIQNTSLATLDLSDEDEVADIFGLIYLPTSADVAKFTSATVVFGNDLTTNYWTTTAATTQADGSAFKVGWNLLKWTWAGSTETGTVAPATIDSIKITCAITGAISNVRFDGFVFSVGRAFDLKYYSKYGFQDSSGTYLVRPTSDSDVVIWEDTAFLIFLEEAKIECAAQMEGTDSGFDIDFARRRLHGDGASPDPITRKGLYAKYRSEYPSETRKPTRSWSSVRNGNLNRR